MQCTFGAVSKLQMLDSGYPMPDSHLMLAILRVVAQTPFALMKWLAKDIFWGVRSNVIVLVKGNMFGISPDRHTWILELSSELFVSGSPMYGRILCRCWTSQALSVT
jgi:hypothetical protein